MVGPRVSAEIMATKNYNTSLIDEYKTRERERGCLIKMMMSLLLLLLLLLLFFFFFFLLLKKKNETEH